MIIIYDFFEYCQKSYFYLLYFINYFSICILKLIFLYLEFKRIIIAAYIFKKIYNIYIILCIYKIYIFQNKCINVKILNIFI